MQRVNHEMSRTVSHSLGHIINSSGVEEMTDPKRTVAIEQVF